MSDRSAAMAILKVNKRVTMPNGYKVIAIDSMPNGNKVIAIDLMPNGNKIIAIDSMPNSAITLDRQLADKNFAFLSADKYSFVSRQEQLH